MKMCDTCYNIFTAGNRCTLSHCTGRLVTIDYEIINSVSYFNKRVGKICRTLYCCSGHDDTLMYLMCGSDEFFDKDCFDVKRPFKLGINQLEPDMIEFHKCLYTYTIRLEKPLLTIQEKIKYQALFNAQIVCSADKLVEFI